MALRTSLALTLTVAMAATAGAQSEKLPPVQAVTPVRTSKDLLTTVSAARQLPDGRVIVNDIGGRKVVIFDSTLSSFSVIADTTSATANAYSSRAAGLIPWKADSTLFVDPNSLSMIVIDPQGRLGRVMSVPRADGANALIGGPNGTPGLDARGRLVYRAPTSIRMGPPPAASNNASGAPAMPMPVFPDSAALVRIELATRKVDTVGFLKVARPQMQVTQTPTGGMSMTSITNPLPQVDDWAVLSEGSVAMVRGQDYHVDWVRGDEAHESTAKLPFQWRHLSDSDKVAYIDSTKSAMEKLREQQMAQMAKGGNTGPIIQMGDGGGMPAGGGMVMMKVEMGARDGGGSPPPRGSTPGGAAAPPSLPPLTFVPPSELPDYAPPFNQGAARGDADGNLWIRTSFGYGGAPVYDVVNQKGELTDRVQLPVGRVIAGFGKGGVIYMGVREGTTGARLEMAKLTHKTQP